MNVATLALVSALLASGASPANNTGRWQAASAEIGLVSACGLGHKTIFVDLGNNLFRDPEFVGQTRNHRAISGVRVGGNISSGDWVVGCIDGSGKFIEETVLSGESVRVVLLNPRPDFNYSLLQDGGSLKASDPVGRKALDAAGQVCTGQMPECDRDADVLDRLRSWLARYELEIATLMTSQHPKVVEAVARCGARGWKGCAIGTQEQTGADRVKVALEANLSSPTPEAATLYSAFLRSHGEYDRAQRSLCAKWKQKYEAFQRELPALKDGGAKIREDVERWSRALANRMTRYIGVRKLLTAIHESYQPPSDVPAGFEDALSWYYWRSNYRHYCEPSEEAEQRNQSSPVVAAAQAKVAGDEKLGAAADEPVKDAAAATNNGRGGGRDGSQTDVNPAPMLAKLADGNGRGRPATVTDLGKAIGTTPSQEDLLDASLTSAFAQYRRAVRLLDHAQSARVLSLAPQEGNARVIVSILAEPAFNTTEQDSQPDGLPAASRLNNAEKQVVNLQTIESRSQKSEAYQLAYDVRPSEAVTVSLGYAVPFYKKKGEWEGVSGPLTAAAFIQGRFNPDMRFLRHYGAGLGLSLSVAREIVEGKAPSIPDLMLGGFVWPIEEVSVGMGIAYSPNASSHVHIGWFFTAAADIPSLIRLVRGTQNVLAR